MSLIIDTVRNYLPARKRVTPSGWLSFNAPCCHHRGESQDKRSRGGAMLNSDNFQYHCFNCGFKAGWSLGKLVSKNTKLLMHWMGIPDHEIKQCELVALKQKTASLPQKQAIDLTLETRQFPNQTKSIDQWLAQDLDPEQEQHLAACVSYITLQRGMDWTWCDWHWSNEPGYRDRVIIPFRYHDQLVGWTARKLTDGRPKYLSDSQNGYVYNLDSQPVDRQYIILVEGPFDAIAVDGCAILTNEPNPAQILRINQLKKEVIVVPDRDRAGIKLITAAMANNWSVSMPPWDKTVKDCADSVRQHGRIYTLASIVHHKRQGELHLELIKRQLQRL